MVDDDAAELREQWLREATTARRDDSDERLVEQFRAEGAALEERRERGADALRSSAGVRPKKPQPGRRSVRTVRLHPAHAWESFRDEITFRTAGSGVAEDLLQYVVDMWVVATDYDLDYARRYWDAGLNPFNSAGIDLISNRLAPEDLGLTFDGRTVLEHLAAGMTARE